MWSGGRKGSWSLPLKGLKYTELIGIKDLGITWHEQPGLIAPNTILAHGDEANLVQYAGGTAAKLVERMGKNVVCGHTHRQGIIWRSTGLRGRLEPLFGFEAGHLMAVRKAAYTRPLNAPNWQMGFGMLEVSGSLVNPISIIMRPDGSFTYSSHQDCFASPLYGRARPAEIRLWARLWWSR